MPRRVTAMIGAVLALAVHVTVVAFDRSTAAVVDNAWLIVVDDLHIDFVNTGHLRTLLRTVASELIQDGDLFELRATGPSETTPLTANRDLLAPTIKGTVGNGLKAADTVGAVSGSPASNEVLYADALGSGLWRISCTRGSNTASRRAKGVRPFHIDIF